MDDRVLAVLEFDKVLDLLEQRCTFSVASELALDLIPSDHAPTVRRLLQLTAEARTLLLALPEFSVRGARDIRASIQGATVGVLLTPQQLMEVQDTLGGGRNLRRAFGRIPDHEARYPGLTDILVMIEEFPALEADITRTVGPRGDILDTASPDLGRIRSQIKVAHNRLLDRVNSLLTSGKYGSAIREAIVTMREGRYVIPVRADARATVGGIVHDTSASGQTVFVEPLETVELNNTWRQLQRDELHEIDRILRRLSDQIAQQSDPLLRTVQGLAEFDFQLAKARFSFDLDATIPTIHDGKTAQRIILTRARHPLLTGEVVPIDIALGEDYRILVITGPNTGGKTVALKTVGLLTLMAQTGLYLPADDQSLVSVFPSLFVDIGDEQSIAQSLSTFSGHMRTVIGMLGQVTADSLVLLDELGAGTDPQEGSALARALIGSVLEAGALAIATTHYSEVKAYAYATPGVENASVEFDVATLSPTYRLMTGVPGRSNALAIATRLGLPRAIVRQAEALLDPDEVRADALLQDIRRRRDEADAIVARAQAAEADAQALRRLAARELREANRERQEARAEALAEAEVQLTDVRDTLRRLQRDRETVAVTREHVEGRRQEVEQAATAVRVFRRERIAKPAVVHSGPGARPIRVGDRVRIVALDEEGEVASVEDGQADILLGSLKLRQPVAALERLGRAVRDQGERTITKPPAPPAPSIELDLRGYRAAEVSEMLDRYLEDAYRSGLPFVRIIHGKGTGALRQVVREFLRDHPAVATHELAPPNEGGDGATIARLREV